MKLNQPATPEDRPKPYAWKSEPIVRFRTDEGKVYLEQFHNLRGVYDEQLQCLGITTPDGTIAITGPSAWDFCEGMCTNQVTMVSTDGEHITSVRFIPKETDL